jgi:hypothetical protein
LVLTIVELAEWKNLSVKLVDMLETTRAREEERRAELRRLELVRSRYRDLLFRYNLWCDQQELDKKFLPFLQDFALQEPLKSALFDNLESGEMPDFTVYDDVIRQLAEEWIAKRDAYLVNLLPQELTTSSSAGNKSELLHLATVYFSPEKSDYSYSEICARRLPDYFGFDTPEEVRRLRVLRPWNLDCHDIKFHQEAHNVAKGIIALCGADPASASTSYMNECSFKLLCLRCRDEPRPWCTGLFAWRAAVRSHCVGDYQNILNRPSSRYTMPSLGMMRIANTNPTILETTGVWLQTLQPGHRSSSWTYIYELLLMSAFGLKDGNKNTITGNRTL